MVLKETGIDLDNIKTFGALKNEIEKKEIYGVDVKHCTHYGDLLDELYKRAVRPKIIQPTFLTHYPVEMIALAKRNEEDKTTINSIQLIIDGVEIIKKVLLDVLKKDSTIDITYLGAPKYRLSITSDNFKSAEKSLKPIIEEIQTNIEKKKGSFKFTREESKKTREN